MKPRLVSIVEEDSRHLSRVPLGRFGAHHAMLWADDWDFLMRLGTPVNWNTVNGHVAVCSARASGNKLSVARILLNAGPGQTVRYLDGNPCNLRKENLRLVRAGWSCRRDRDYLIEEII